jgi:membrane-bound metal-dependent hydrolase YbcI (DUF457 family)
MFPDSDIVAELFDGRNIAMLELHRGFTHSFVCWPVFALALAGSTHWVAKKRGWAAPSWQKLTVIYATGIALHIFLDLITSFGTMIWSPISNYRAALDTNFILDFFMTAAVLVPQLAAWAYRQRRGWFTRALLSWVLLSLSAAGLERMSRAAGFPFSPWAVVVIAAVLAVIFFAPARAGWGFGVRRAAWCRVGAAAFAIYLALSGAAQIAARSRVHNFARERGLAVEHLAALPLPPSPLRWSGMIRTPEGVWVARFRLTDAVKPQYEFFADSPPNEYIAKAEGLRSVKTYLWFARFPVARYEEREGLHVVEWSDLRFFPRPGRPHPFEFRVVFDGNGNVVKEGWTVEDWAEGKERNR